MLNLLVGILSEKLGDIVANKTISSYRLFLGSCIEQETFRGIFYCSGKTDRRVHLVFATMETEEAEWEGQVNAIKIALKAAENRLNAKSEARNKSTKK